MMKKNKWFYPKTYGFLLVVFHLHAAVGQVLVDAESTWKYFKGVRQPDGGGLTWAGKEYDDSGWDTGDAPFRYGDGNGGTVLGDMRNGYSTLFLRKSFVVEDPALVGRTELVIDYDDGFIVWVNGKQVLSVNAPVDPDFNSFAGSNHESGNPEIFVLGDPSDIFLRGENVVAVQVFNVNLTSSDLFFDVQIAFSPRDSIAPTLVSIHPLPGSVLESLDQIILTFSEPVQGVATGSLLVNGSGAVDLVGGDNAYTFVYTNAQEGWVDVFLDPNHFITDLAVPANRLDTRETGESWRYKIVDLMAPAVTELRPPVGSRVSKLEYVEITFSEWIVGLDSGDLKVNGRDIIGVEGAGAGPYRIELPPLQPGSVQITWNPDHGIRDESEPPNAFAAVPISYRLEDEPVLATLHINEFLASNQSGILDEEGLAQDWIELYNAGGDSVALAGYSLTDDPAAPGKWVFPDVSIPPQSHLVLYASGKDKTVRMGAIDFIHTNFKLSAFGEFLGLYTPDAPRRLVHSTENPYPEQRNDVSYGLLTDGTWAYFRTATPGEINPQSGISGLTPEPVFSVARGWFDHGFDLALHCEDRGAEIRYTLNGSEPTQSGGNLYSGPFPVSRTSIVRAAAFAASKLPSKVVTHSYFFNLPETMTSLPILSLVTDNSNLFGQTGIMETSPRNTVFRGMDWERPVSAEWMEVNGEGFQIDCGLRVQGGNYVRERYNPRGSLPFSKYSFRLYFRGDYGPGKLEYPVIPESPVQTFDKIVLRAGMNDHSNPFIVDELVRRLAFDVGLVSSRGTFVNLFINGQFKGYYNPTERIDDDFMRAWHGGENDWDVIAQFGEVREGDASRWNRLRTQILRSIPSSRASYESIAQNLDLTNFIDYLLVNIYSGTGDWPHNNWRAARERTADGIFRFYIWDAEWAFGNAGRSVTVNTLTQELRNDSDISNFYQSLKSFDEFRLLFADRVQRHMYDEGALTDEHILSVFNDLKGRMSGVLPNMRSLDRLWIGSRRRIILQHMAAEGLLSSVTAPSLSRHGGTMSVGDTIQVHAPAGDILVTVDGTDPREFWTGAVSETARILASGATLALKESGTVKARSYLNGEWSALTEAEFEIEPKAVPIILSEIMYHPASGEAFEFIEFVNRSGLPFDLTGFALKGVDFRFPPGSRVAPGEVFVLVSDQFPAQFAARYPDVRIQGYYRGSLSNSGETLQWMDPMKKVVLSVDYSDGDGWPSGADGGGASLVLIHPDGPYSDPSSWRISNKAGGGPGVYPDPWFQGGVRFNEIMANNEGIGGENGPADWIEITNPSPAPVSLEGWGVSDDPENPYRFQFPTGSFIEPGGFLLLSAEPTSRMNIGFGLDKDGESLWLVDPDGKVVDSVSFGRQVAGYSLGMTHDEWELNFPTPGSENKVALLAERANISLNEWAIGDADRESNWIECANLSTELPLGLKGLIFETNQGRHAYAHPTFIEPGGFLRIWVASGKPGPDRLDLVFDKGLDFIQIIDEHQRLLDKVQPSFMGKDFSQGRFPDGSDNIRFFQFTASPGSSNYLPQYSGPILNELLTKGVDQEPGWIELYYGTNAVEHYDLSGMVLSIVGHEASTWTIPSGVKMAPGTYLVLDCDSSRPPSTGLGPGPLNTGRSLPIDNGSVALMNQRGLTVDKLEFGFQIPGWTIGLKSNAWLLMARPTAGSANSENAAFANNRELRINEWMADPLEGNDWFEVFNPSDKPVWLSGIQLTDSPALFDRDKHRVVPLSFIGPGGWVVWQADGDAGKGANHVNFNLNARGESILIYDGANQLIDTVQFDLQSPGLSTGRLPDGSDAISVLTRPTPGRSNLLVDVDADGDGMPDEWERRHGLNPIRAGDAGEDSDGDGLSNQGEYVAGTDPTDPASHLRLEMDWIPGGQWIRLRFQAVEGRRYRIESGTALKRGGGWDIEGSWDSVSKDMILELEKEKPAGDAAYYRLKVIF